MSVPDRKRPKALVAGGSLGGLFAGVALRAVGCEVEVYERSAGALTSRGGGIVVQPELTRFFNVYDPDGPATPTTACSRRRYLAADGSVARELPMPQSFTSWDVLFAHLKRLFPGERYHADRRVTDWRTDEDGQARFDFDFDGGDGAVGDLALCSDGSDSGARRRLLPGVEPHYAGYIAWRGTVAERDATERVRRALDDSFTFCHLNDGHILCYPIPGDAGDTTPGGRRLNWVWYVDVPAGPELTDHLTGRDGRVRRASVPAGHARTELVGRLRDKARRELPPSLAELVESTTEPYLQVVADVAAPRTVFGRVCLLGDAAFVVRPHTAAATAKAAAEAMTLADALAEGLQVDVALSRLGQFQQLLGGRLVRHGMNLGSKVRT